MYVHCGTLPKAEYYLTAKDSGATTAGEAAPRSPAGRASSLAGSTPAPCSPYASTRLRFSEERIASRVQHAHSSRSEHPELALILPRIHQRNFSGGPNTALIFAAEIAKAGYHIHCLSEITPTCSSEELRAHLREMLGVDDDAAGRFRVSRITPDLFLHANDRLLATAWWTTCTARTLASRMEKQRIGYFIQDFEPFFHLWDEQHAGAMLFYGIDCLPVINEPSLARLFFMMQPGRVTGSAFRENTQIFMPAVDRHHFYPEPHRGRHTLLFYARPAQARNLYHFGMAAIARLVLEDVINAQEWDVRCMRQDDLPLTHFGKGVVSRTLTWLGFADYTAHIRQASGRPFAHVVAAYQLHAVGTGGGRARGHHHLYLNKTSDVLSELSPHIIGVEAEIEAITDGLRKAVHMAAQADTRTVPSTHPRTEVTPSLRSCHAFCVLWKRWKRRNRKP